MSVHAKNIWNMKYLLIWYNDNALSHSLFLFAFTAKEISTFKPLYLLSYRVRRNFPDNIIIIIINIVAVVNIITHEN